MIHHTTPSFWSSYYDLPKEIRHRAETQFELLKTDNRHPSLQFKKIGLSKGREIWSARVTLRYRALAIYEPDHFVWFWIGDHATYDQMIAS